MRKTSSDGLEAFVSDRTKTSETLVPEEVPFIRDRDRATIRTTYLPAQEHKALAISLTQIGIASGQSNDEAAKLAALNSCPKGHRRRRCHRGGATLRALRRRGYGHLRGRSPPATAGQPWVIRDALVERPFNANDVPFLNDKARAVVAKWYGISGLHNKALAVSPRGIRGLLP